MEYKSFFKTVAGNEGDRCRYSTRLDTYGKGCAHNCAYCYARSLLQFRGLWNPAEPSVADLNKVRRVIWTELHPGDVVRLGGMTDCFQPIEREQRATRRTIEFLNDRRVHYLIVTKSPMVAEYCDVLDRRLAHIQISITSTSEQISKRIEPGAPFPALRVKAVEKLQGQGYDVSVRLSPYVLEFVDIEAVNKICCDKILVEFLRVNGFIRKWLSGLSFDDYTVKSSGYCHLPLEKKIELIGRISGFYKQISVCEDVPEHWRYWREHVNHNSEDCCNLNLAGIY